SQNMAFVSSSSSTNEVNTAYGVSTANTQVNPASTQVSTSSTQSTKRSQLVYEDLEQIHEDNIEEMDLKWQLALLSMRTRRGPRNQDNRNRNQDNSRRTVNVEENSSKAMVAIDGAATYKRGLASVEEQLVFYKKNEVIFYEQLAVLKRDISYKDSEISMLKSELEKLKQEKESNQLKIENFDNASKRLFSPPKLDLSNSGLEEFQQPEFEGYGPKTSKSVSEDISNEVRESPDALLVEELVSDDKLTAITIKGKGWVIHKKKIKAMLTVDSQGTLQGTRPISQTLKNLMEDMLPLGKEPNEGKLLAKELLKLMCDKKNSILFTDTGCFVLSSDFKLVDESQVLLKVPRKNNMYSVDMKNIVPKESLTCLVAKATLDESML
ncbi:hypothetical protein Tco_1374847, partial [Tanacetum coccineum]